jgi:hypothetical protein
MSDMERQRTGNHCFEGTFLFGSQVPCSIRLFIQVPVRFRATDHLSLITYTAIKYPASQPCDVGPVTRHRVLR